MTEHVNQENMRHAELARPGLGTRRAGGARRAACRYSALRIPHSACTGFTLVELLVVIAILTILIGLVTAGAQTARRRAAVAKAKTTIAALETAIAMYVGDLGVYPASENANLVSALSEDPGGSNWYGPYMEFKQDELLDGELLDPWGRPYIYLSVNGGSPQHRETSYDLYSFGPNGVDDAGAGDDIVNW